MPWCGVGGDAFAMIRTATGETPPSTERLCPCDDPRRDGSRARCPVTACSRSVSPASWMRGPSWRSASPPAPSGAADTGGPRRSDGIEIDDRLRTALASLEARAAIPTCTAASWPSATTAASISRARRDDPVRHRPRTRRLLRGCGREPHRAARAASGGALSMADLAAHRGTCRRRWRSRSEDRSSTSSRRSRWVCCCSWPSGSPSAWRRRP